MDTQLRPVIPLDLVDADTRERTIRRLRRLGVRLPTLGQLANPETLDPSLRARLGDVDPDLAHPLNLLRVHWFNGPDRRSLVEVPAHLVLPRELTGVDAPIIVALGSRFPMIGAHKVLAAYACLVPRLVTGRFDPENHRAVWPSTGNYCRGGVAISRILGCRGVAVLPEGMSQERFAWLERWVSHPEDIIRTPGTESSVREIYAECETLARDPQNQILNQFAQFENHLAHRAVTGPALARCFEHVATRQPRMTLAAFVSATGSAGTIGAGDHLKDVFGSRTVAVEALECPTLLRNGYGAHNIQGIGDKHIPLIHNVMRTDLVVGVSDQATDHLDAVFQSDVGRRYLSERRHVPEPLIASLGDFGLSAICNVIAAIKTAKYLGLGPDEAIITVATDGADLYPSERRALFAHDYAEGFDTTDAAESFGRYLLGAEGHVLELTEDDRHRIFNLGYFTWVEQLGVPLADFEARRSQRFWRELVATLPELDARIAEMDAEVARG